MRCNVSDEVKYFAYVRYATSTIVAAIPCSVIHFVGHNHLRYDRYSLCILTIWRPSFDPSSVLVELLLDVETLGQVFSKYLRRTLSLSFYYHPHWLAICTVLATLTSNVCVCGCSCVCVCVCRLGRFHPFTSHEGP